LNNFGISSEHLNWIKKILTIFLPEGSKVFVFGSRARGDYKKYSDLDLAILSKEPIQSETLLQIQEHFSESSIPFKIDLVDLNKIDPDFKLAIEKEKRSLNALNVRPD
jgi:predicted nucleotidyltransferase